MAGTFDNSFATHFHNKVKTNIEKVKVNSLVCNGKCQLIVANINFMKSDDVKCCLNDLSSKKCEGFDQIPDVQSMMHMLSSQGPFLCSLTKFIALAQSQTSGKYQKLSQYLRSDLKLKLKITGPLQIFVVLQKNLKKLILKQIHYLESTNKLDLKGISLVF